MLRLLAPGLLGLVFFAVWIFAVLDVIATDEILMRNLPKMAWLFVVVFIPTVGAVAWLALGRPIGAGFQPGTTRAGPNRSWQQKRGFEPRRPRGVEDRDDWGASTNPSAPDDGFESTAAKERRLREWEAELKRREGEFGEEPDET